VPPTGATIQPVQVNLSLIQQQPWSQQRAEQGAELTEALERLLEIAGIRVFLVWLICWMGLGMWFALMDLDQFWTRGLLASSRCRLPSCLAIQVSPCWASHFFQTRKK